MHHIERQFKEREIPINMELYDQINEIWYS